MCSRERTGLRSREGTGQTEVHITQLIVKLGHFYIQKTFFPVLNEILAVILALGLRVILVLIILLFVPFCLDSHISPIFLYVCIDTGMRSWQSRRR